MILFLILLCNPYLAPQQLTNNYLLSINQYDSRNFTQQFELTAHTEKNGGLNNVTSINISVPSADWNLTRIEINFSKIECNKLTKVIEDEFSNTPFVYKNRKRIAIQMNLTEASKIYSVSIYGQALNPTADLAYIEIDGYDTGGDYPNTTVYGQTLLNMSDSLGWYKQTFPTPVELPAGYYFLTLNWTACSASTDGPRYYWYSNNLNPKYQYLHYAETNPGNNWNNGIIDETLLHSLEIKINKNYTPSKINLTAVVGGNNYIVSDGAFPGIGNVTIEDIYVSAGGQTFTIPTQNNGSIQLRFNLTYSITMINKFQSDGFVSISGSQALWNVTPNIIKYYNNFSINFKIPSSWNTIRIYRNGGNITNEVIFSAQSFTILNNSIFNGSNWLINANNNVVDTTLNIPKTSYEGNQILEFTVTTPVSGDITFYLEDSFGFLQYNKTKNVVSSQTAFSYSFRANPQEGNWKIYIFWQNGTDIGYKSSTITILNPMLQFTLLLAQSISMASASERQFNSLITILMVGSVIAAVCVSSYYSIRKVRRNRENYRKRIFNKYKDALNMRMILIAEKAHNLLIYEQTFMETTKDSSLIAGFLDAIRNFGLELLDTEDKSQTIKLEYKQNKILMSEYKNFRIVLMMEEAPTAELLNSLETLAQSIEEKFGHLIKTFDGNVKAFQGLRDLIEDKLEIKMIHPLKIDWNNRVKLSSKEAKLLKKAIKLMKTQNKEYIFVTTLLEKEKKFQYKNAETILNLINKKVLIPAL
ncbi:MAG: hypothetical protein ACTSRG_21330 [Candidatus Helarchaeota archaeon]